MEWTRTAPVCCTRNDRNKTERTKTNSNKTPAKSNKSDRYPVAHNVLVAGSSSARPPAFAREASKAAAPSPSGEGGYPRELWLGSHHNEINRYRGSFSAGKLCGGRRVPGRANEINALEPRPADRRHFFCTSVTHLMCAGMFAHARLPLLGTSQPNFFDQLCEAGSWDTCGNFFSTPGSNSGSDRCTHRGKWLDSRSCALEVGAMQLGLQNSTSARSVPARSRR